MNYSHSITILCLVYIRSLVPHESHHFSWPTGPHSNPTKDNEIGNSGNIWVNYTEFRP